MSKRAIALLTILAACAGCGGGGSSAKPDANGKQPDAPGMDAMQDAPPVDGQMSGDGIAAARAAADGTGLTLAIDHVTITYLKPQIGNATNDPAGFTIQAQKTGPALFVSVDPTTLTPPAAVGDVVSFTITTMGTVAMQRRAQAISNYTRHSTGANVSALAQDVSSATDLVTNLDSYDSELVNITGSAADAFATSGQGFVKATLTTTGITGDTNLQLRAPATIADGIDMTQGCTIAAHNVPVGRFNAQAQIGAYTAADVMLTSCPAPVVAQALSLSGTSVRVTFSRNVLPSSVMANGSQFTFDNGLTASAATVSGRTVTLTTTAQGAGTMYMVSVANTITDLQGSPVAAASSSGTFAGFLAPAIVRINEVNANVGSNCDLIELRVIAGGSMAGFKLTERTGTVASNELSFTFPAGFTVQKNDFIVVHTGSGSATCNPGTATSETTTKADQPVATYPGNFDTAFDFWSNDTGLVATDNVFTLFDSTNAIIDAAFVSNDPAGGSAAAATETAAAAVGTANQWAPAMTMYIDTVFRMNAADDLDATGTTAVANSIQRVNDTDTNGKADWTTGAGAPSTWGALNPGQAALP